MTSPIVAFTNSGPWVLRWLASRPHASPSRATADGCWQIILTPGNGTSWSLTISGRTVPERSADGKEWTTANLNVDASPSYCHDDAERNCRRNGRLYTWESAQRVCRSIGDGWRLPTDDEWRQLATHYSGLGNDSPDSPRSPRKLASPSRAGNWGRIRKERHRRHRKAGCSTALT